MGLLHPFFRLFVLVICHETWGQAFISLINPVFQAFGVGVWRSQTQNPLPREKFEERKGSRYSSALYGSFGANNSTDGSNEFGDLGNDEHMNLMERLTARLEFLESVVMEQREEIMSLQDRVGELEEALLTERETLPQLLEEAGVYEYTDEEWEELVKSKTSSDEDLASFQQPQQPFVAGQENIPLRQNASIEEGGPGSMPLLMPGPTEVSQTLFEDPASKEYLTIQVPSNIMEAADQAGSSVLEALVQGHRRLVVEVIDDALRDVRHMAEFIDLMLLPLAGTLQNSHQLEQRRCSIIFPSMTQLHQAKKAMSLEDPEIFTLNTLNNARTDDRDFLTMVVDPWSDAEDSYGGLSVTAKRLLKDPHHRSVLIVTHRPLPKDHELLSEFGCAYYIKPMKLQFLKDSSGSPQIISEGEATSKQHHTGTAIVQRQFPGEWVVIVNLGRGGGYQLAGAFEEMPSTQRVHQTLLEYLRAQPQ
mmetsp:Transcript_6117/g.7963  ORF Transcript_6117/g.7963 Transcript_6117/m.7963 type:complete len:476 (-) Transcript_6117:522-1949(-)